MRLFDAVRSFKQRAILMTAYATGLRLAEVTHLQVSDIDSERLMIRVGQGKDRKTAMSCFPKKGQHSASESEPGWLLFAHPKPAPDVGDKGRGCILAARLAL